MKLRDCIMIAATTLNIDDALSGSNPDIDELLIRCANNCLDEITSEYLPYKCEKEVEAVDGSIPYSMISDTIYDVLSVKSDLGNIKFELMPSRIKVAKDGKYTVKFCTRLPKLNPDDEIPIQLHLTPRVVAYGIATEYLLLSGFYEEAVTYDKRFKDAIARAAYGSSEKRIKRRRWLL